MSPAGTAAEIPDNAQWEATLGSVDSNGVFTSDGTTGVATVSMTVDGVTVGETTINVVIPDKLSFKNSTEVISYGKEFELNPIATYTSNGFDYEVTLKDGDIAYSLSDEAMGSLNGNIYTTASSDAEVIGGVITATLVEDETVTATLNVSLTTLPDEPVIYEGFEGDKEFSYTAHWSGDFISYKAEIVTAENGKVHSGDKSYAVTYETTPYGLGSYIGGFRIMNTAKDLFKDLDLTNAKTLGMWIYIPEDCTAEKVQFRLRNYNDSSQQLQAALFCQGYATTESGHRGWQYFEIDLEGYNDGNWFLESIDLYTCTRDDSADWTAWGYDYEYDPRDYQSIVGPFTFYLDDITVEYLEFDVDREDPTFDYVKVTYGGLSDAVTLNGQTITDNVVSFVASASDDGVGIDYSSAIAYIDGVKVEKGFSCTDTGLMVIDDVTLADGVHTITFVISDKNGNCDWVSRQININADSDIPTVTVKAAEDNATQPLLGSIYWLDVEVDNIEDVESVSILLNLNATSDWEFDGISTVYGFDVSYELDEVSNDATITFISNGECTETGHSVLAKIPVRMFYNGKSISYTGTQSPMDIKVTLDMGTVTYADGTNTTFSMTKIDVDSEIYKFADEMTSGTSHVHSAAAVDDKAATCTEAGYTGRTFCEGCNSVVDWGTIEKATGHTYDFVDDVLKCTNDDCDKTFTGTFTDGKLYADGLCVNGWVDESYYVDGLAVTGIYVVDGVYYSFDDKGVSEGKYTGLVTIDGKYYYSKLGVLSGGWYEIEGEWYYFDEDTLTTVTEKTFTYEYGHQATYQFYENGKIVSGVWLELDLGTRYYYGPAYYKLNAKRGNAFWVTIDGNKYAFDGMGFRHEGISFIVESNNPQQLMVFSDEGVYQNTYTGMYEGYYYADGYKAPGAGLILFEGDYYYISTGSKPYVGTLYVTEAKANGLVKANKYTFAEDGKMVIEPAKNGIIDGKYYVNDELVKGAGVVEFEGDLYFINMAGKVYTNGTLAIGEAKANGLVKPGKYTFGADGKMIIEPEKNGIVDGMYYVDGELIKGAGVVEFEGDLYFINMAGKVYTNGTLAIGEAKANGLVEPGKYTFDEDGKMIIESAKNGIVNGMYYEDGELIKGAGVVEFEGNYYFINMAGKVYIGSISIGEAKTNGYIAAGSYTTDADGKLIIE